MPSWVLLLFVFLVWCLWAVAAAADFAAEDALRGVPAEQRRGVSVFPILPVFPLILWGFAWLIDRAAGSWGSVIVGAGHLVFAVYLTVSIVRNSRRFRGHRRPTDLV